MRQILIVVGLIFGLVAIASAQSYEDAEKAIERKDFKSAIGTYMSLAIEGEAKAQDRLALFYAKGLGGLKRDFAKAENLWQQAAEKSYAPAFYNLGVHYLTHSKGIEDTKKAYMWLFLANARGETKAREAMALADKALSASDKKAIRKSAFFCIKQQFKACEVK